MGLKIFSFCLDTEVVDRIDKISDARSEFVRSRPFVTNAAFAHFGTNGGMLTFAATCANGSFAQLVYFAKSRERLRAAIDGARSECPRRALNTLSIF